MTENRPARRVDVVGVVLALVLLTVASVGLSGNPWWFLQSAVKWIVAGAIALIGIGLLLGSLPSRTSNNRSSTERSSRADAPTGGRQV